MSLGRTGRERAREAGVSEGEGERRGEGGKGRERDGGGGGGGCRLMNHLPAKRLCDASSVLVGVGLLISSCFQLSAPASNLHRWLASCLQHHEKESIVHQSLPAST